MKKHPVVLEGTQGALIVSGITPEHKNGVIIIAYKS